MEAFGRKLPDNVFDLLEERGLIANVTNRETVRDILGKEKITFYIGFDPTADSLHVGHFLQLMVMHYMQMYGHRPIALIGGGTCMIGDPSGKADMRRVMPVEEIDANGEKFKVTMRKFIDFSDGKAIMLNNADWLRNIPFIDYLREVGWHFTVNKMLSSEAFKVRMEREIGLTFTEFSYMTMQAYDFYHMFKEYNCVAEFGGSDQWTNILAGTELIRKKTGKDSYGVTFNLLTTSDGVKMGKTVKGAVWLDSKKTSPYEFFQYWRNIDDADVANCLRMLTLVPLDVIDDFVKRGGSAYNEAKELLAYTLTEQIHSKEDADMALNTSKALFGKKIITDDMPSFKISDKDFTDGKINILDLLVCTKLSSSKSEARRLVNQGGVTINDEKVENIDICYSAIDFKDSFVIKKGKKTFLRIAFEN
jgi:tyrosyl-tRNA synthetase